jgi:hypothetical protein
MSSNHIKVVSIVVECAPIIFWFYTWKVTCVPFFFFLTYIFINFFLRSTRRRKRYCVRATASDTQNDEAFEDIGQVSSTHFVDPFVIVSCNHKV